MNLLLLLFFLTSPALILYLCKQYKFLDNFGAVGIAYIVGLIIGNLEITDINTKYIQETITTIVIPLSLPLLLMSVNLKQWSRLASRTALSMILGIIAIVVSIIIGFFIFRYRIDEPWRVAGLLTGVYLGATFNMAAIKMAIGASDELFGVVNALDIIVCMFYFLFLITVAQKLFNKFLPKFDKSKKNNEISQSIDDMHEGWDAYRGIFSKKILFPLLMAIGVAAAIAGTAFCISTVIGKFFPNTKIFSVAIIILSITTLSILSSTVHKLNRIKKTFQAGMYFILIFCVVVGSMADISLFAHTSIYLLFYVFLVIFGSLFLHFLFAWIFKIDTDTVIITSVAMIFSPPFVPAIANALHNREIILSGLTVGLIGYSIGNYIGIALAYFLR